MTDRMTDERTFAILESLSRLKSENFPNGEDRLCEKKGHGYISIYLSLNSMTGKVSGSSNTQG